MSQPYQPDHGLSVDCSRASGIPPCDDDVETDRAATERDGQLWSKPSNFKLGPAAWSFNGPCCSVAGIWLAASSAEAFEGTLASRFVGLGNRRDFLAMFIFLAGMIASRRRATIGFRTVTIALFAFVVFMLFGIVRQMRSAPWLVYHASDTLVLVAEQNEFLYPIQTVMYYVTAKEPLEYGMTYLSAPNAFIPRALWPEKPLGLSLQFSRDQFGDVIVPGYTYTPVTEAYINFSFVGPFIVMSLVSLATVFLVKHARRRPMLYFVCFALALEFNRGDSAGVLYFLVVVGVAFSLMKFVSRIEWAPKALQDMWPPPTTVERVSGA